MQPRSGPPPGSRPGSAPQRRPRSAIRRRRLRSRSGVWPSSVAQTVNPRPSTTSSWRSSRTSPATGLHTASRWSAVPPWRRNPTESGADRLQQVARETPRPKSATTSESMGPRRMSVMRRDSYERRLREPETIAASSASKAERGMRAALDSIPETGSTDELDAAIVRIAPSCRSETRTWTGSRTTGRTSVDTANTVAPRVEPRSSTRCGSIGRCPEDRLDSCEVEDLLSHEAPGPAATGASPGSGAGSSHFGPRVPPHLGCLRSFSRGLRRLLQAI